MNGGLISEVLLYCEILSDDRVMASHLNIKKIINGFCTEKSRSWETYRQWLGAAAESWGKLEDFRDSRETGGCDAYCPPSAR